MKIIPLIGILHFFGPLIFYKSRRALLIFINGIIFHSLDKSGIYYYPFTLKYAILGTLIYTFEIYCNKYIKLEYYYIDILHLFFHIIAGYSLLLTL